jgi:glutamyl-tRNA reductase
MVIGLNHRTAPLAMRERFWVSEKRRYEVLRDLKSADGIEEVVVLSTCCRTEFLVWASEPTIAANSLLQFLTSQYALKLSEWEHFYRRLDDIALTHIFRVACGLDSQVLCEQYVTTWLQAAWEQARTVGSSSYFLNAVIEKALLVASHVAQQTDSTACGTSILAAALDLAERILGSLQGRSVLLLGASEISERSADAFKNCGAKPLLVMDQSPLRAHELANKIGGTAVTLADRWKCMVRADVVICSTGCPHLILTKEEAERIAEERNRVALIVIDIGMPRDVDPDVRRVDGILLYDLDGLERLAKSKAADNSARNIAAEKIVAAEVQTFRNELRPERIVPTIVALRRSLDEFRRQELESFIEERGPFPREQEQLLQAITTQVIQKIAGSLARELKDLSGKGEQEQMTAAVTRLFHLDSPHQAIAGTNSEREKNERRKQQAVANY